MILLQLFRINQDLQEVFNKMKYITKQIYFTWKEASEIRNDEFPADLKK